MEIISYAILGLLIVISPGADFVLVFKNSLSSGRKAGLMTGLGIGLGICIHITYSILGISHLLSQNAAIFSMIKYAGSAYLIYLGLSGLFSSKLVIDIENENPTGSSAKKYFAQGFLCNALNPKTILFFLSVFSQLVSPENDNNLLFVLICGLYITLLHVVWFCFLAFLVTSTKVLSIFQQFGRRINQVCGAGLVTFGVMLSANN
ncbi:LysE family translocator [Vibrio hangzhouensis]|uniref:Resistance to homoserine/threonine (RhtB) family protein n=1 Tax=Vibrio hangzhouensis TaxID=462991 RepID=A0A1H6A6R3_9VIBR|nr:LysE family translocator [Vibrio hangzhouensis]SEG44429.1 resistance to homoserine/threonine (RhtB) family protein [Vibrio hangzhouensis]